MLILYEGYKRKEKKNADSVRYCQLYFHVLELSKLLMVPCIWSFRAFGHFGSYSCGPTGKC